MIIIKIKMWSSRNLLFQTIKLVQIFKGNIIISIAAAAAAAAHYVML